MSLKLGNTTVGSLYLGSTKIGAAYLGSTKVYESAVAPTSEALYATCYASRNVYSFGDLTSSLASILTNNAVTVTLTNMFAPGQSGRSYYLSIYPASHMVTTMPSSYLIFGSSPSSFPNQVSNWFPDGSSVVYDVNNVNTSLSNLSLANVLADPTSYTLGAFVYSSSSASFKGVCYSSYGEAVPLARVKTASATW